MSEETIKGMLTGAKVGEYGVVSNIMDKLYAEYPLFVDIWIEKQGYIESKEHRECPDTGICDSCSTYKLCPTCRGIGKVRKIPQYGGLYKCDICNGTGRVKAEPKPQDVK